MVIAVQIIQEKLRKINLFTANLTNSYNKILIIETDGKNTSIVCLFFKVMIKMRSRCEEKITVRFEINDDFRPGKF